MPRLIEIALFLAPFLCFTTWRLLFPSPMPPLWLAGAFAAMAVVMLAVLLYLRHLDAGDPTQAYIPARLLDGRVLPDQRAPRP